MRNIFKGEQVIYLNPIDSHKSFYGKCFVIGNKEHGYMLYSYNTLVARFIPDVGIIRSWSGYSATTMRHINAFCAFCGVHGYNKAEWDKVRYL